MSPVAVPPRALYRPSSPEGSEKDASYQPSFIDLEKTEQKSNRTRTLRERKPVAMVARSSPYGAEADGDDGRAAKKEKSDAIKDGHKKKDDKKSSKGSSKARQSTVETAEGDADVKRDSCKNNGGLELNNSTLAALKYCNSSEGSKLSEMSSKELKSLSKTLARANIDDAQEIYNVLVNFINNKMIASKDVTEASQRLSDVFESTGRKVSSRKAGEPQEGDAMTFYHSDTSCEVSPTDPKFHTMSSISSPPLDSSSPKSSGSSIGVQTDSNGVSVIPTTLTTVASSEGKGSPVSSNNFARSSTQATGQYGVSEQITTSNLAPPTRYGGIPGSVQTAGATSSGALTTSPVLSAEYVTITSRTTPTGHPNTIPPTSRTLTPEEQNNPPSRPYRSQSTTSSVPNQQHIYGADNRPFGFPESQIVHHLGRATYPPGVPRHPGYETALITTTDVPRQMYQVGQPYHQTTKTDQLDPTTRRPVARSSHPMAASIQAAAAASWNVMSTQSHDVFLPGHANTEGGRHLVRAEHANVDPTHVNPLSNNAVRVPGYIPPQSNDPNFATSHGIPIQSHEIPDQGHALRRNDHGISDPEHGVALSSQAVFKPLQTGQPNDAIPASRQGTSSYPVPHTGGNILAQSCPAFTARQLASPDLYPGCSVQPGACRPPERTRTMSSNQTTAYHIPSKTTAVPHGAQTAFNYQDVGPEQFHVVSDVYNECGRRPRDWVASGQRQVRVTTSCCMPVVDPPLWWVRHNY